MDPTIKKRCYCKGDNPLCQYPLRSCLPPNVPLPQGAPPPELFADNNFAPPNLSLYGFQLPNPHLRQLSVDGQVEQLRQDMEFQLGAVHSSMDKQYRELMMRMDKLENSVKQNNGGQVGETVRAELLRKLQEQGHGVIEGTGESVRSAELQVVSPNLNLRIDARNTDKFSGLVASDPVDAPPARMSPASQNSGSKSRSNENALPKTPIPKAQNSTSTPTNTTGSSDTVPSASYVPASKAHQPSQNSSSVNGLSSSKSAASVNDSRDESGNSTSGSANRKTQTKRQVSSKQTTAPELPASSTSFGHFPEKKSQADSQKPALISKTSMKSPKKAYSSKSSSGILSVKNVDSSKVPAVEAVSDKKRGATSKPQVQGSAVVSANMHLEPDTDKNSEASARQEDPKPVIVAVYANKPVEMVAVEEKVDEEKVIEEKVIEKKVIEKKVNEESSSKKDRKSAKKRAKDEEKRQKEKKRKDDALRTSIHIETSLLAYLGKHSKLRKNIDYSVLRQTHGLWRRIARFVMTKRHEETVPPKSIKAFLKARHEKNKKEGKEELSCLYLSLLVNEDNQVVQEDAEFLSKNMTSIKQYETAYLKLVCGEDDGSIEDEEIPEIGNLENYMKSLPDQKQLILATAFGNIISATKAYVEAQTSLRNESPNIDVKSFPKIMQLLLVRDQSAIADFENVQDPKTYFRERAATYAIMGCEKFAVHFLYLSEIKASVLDWDAFSMSRVPTDDAEARIRLDTSYLMLMLDVEARHRELLA